MTGGRGGGGAIFGEVADASTPGGAGPASEVVISIGLIENGAADGCSAGFNRASNCCVCVQRRSNSCCNDCNRCFNRDSSARSCSFIASLSFGFKQKERRFRNLRRAPPG